MVVEPGIGDLGQSRLGTIGYPKASLLNHQSVVGAIADGENVLPLKAPLLPHFDERVGTPLGIDDVVRGLFGTGEVPK